ncbi:hypothetical protein M8J76_013865 [Diaphorina citri]|nr:hypothetical protein M8J76_013865 [Diaphorina citri]
MSGAEHRAEEVTSANESGVRRAQDLAKHIPSGGEIAQLSSDPPLRNTTGYHSVCGVTQVKAPKWNPAAGSPHTLQV